MREFPKQLVSAILTVYSSKNGGLKSAKNSSAVLYFWVTVAYLAHHGVGSRGLGVGRRCHCEDAALVEDC